MTVKETIGNYRRNGAISHVTIAVFSGRQQTLYEGSACIIPASLAMKKVSARAKFGNEVFLWVHATKN